MGPMSSCEKSVESFQRLKKWGPLTDSEGSDIFLTVGQRLMFFGNKNHRKHLWDVSVKGVRQIYDFFVCPIQFCTCIFFSISPRGNLLLLSNFTIGHLE